MKLTVYNLIIYAELNHDIYHPLFYVLLTVHLSIILVINQLNVQNLVSCRSQWPRGLWRWSAASRLLRLWVRIPPGAWMFGLL